MNGVTRSINGVRFVAKIDESPRGGYVFRVTREGGRMAIRSQTIYKSISTAGVALDDFFRVFILACSTHQPHTPAPKEGK